MNPISISALTDHIAALFEDDDLLRDIWVLAEVGSWKKAASGHIYFSLKDSGAFISAVLWRGNAFRHTWLPRIGDQVLAHGYAGVYAERGVYQFYADEIRPAGRGQLYARFEALKEKLEAEGLFDASRKRAIPQPPRRLGIVTSPSAAALQDALRVLGQRWPLADVILFPTQVQGAEAPGQIAASLAAANRFPAEDASTDDSSTDDRSTPDPADLPLLAGWDGNESTDLAAGNAPLDVILLVRGGGSIEDLWAFNEERVAYAIAASETPVIAGIGHETDFTIADFVADLRAPTPTAAAIAAAPDRWETLEGIRHSAARLAQLGSAAVTDRQAHLAELRRRLERAAPARQIDRARQQLDEEEERLHREMLRILDQRRERLAYAAARLKSLNPSSILARGYSIVQRADGAVVTAPEQASPGDRLRVRAAGGTYPVRRERDGQAGPNLP